MASNEPKSALITGCSDDGIGSALAIAFQKRGYTVFACLRNPKKATSLSALPNVTITTLDVTSPPSIAAAEEVVRTRTGGRLDVLINNAGQTFSAPLLDSDLDAGRKLFEVNFWGAIAMVQAFAPMLVKAKGVVVNISSMGAIVNYPYIGLSASSKAALSLASETLKLELQPLGVRTITLMAGMVKTKIHDNVPEVALPENSYYQPVEDKVKATTAVEGNMVKWQTPVQQFADEVVEDILKGSEGLVYKGGMSSVLRWSKMLLPTWMMVGILETLHSELLAKHCLGTWTQSKCGSWCARRSFQ